MTVLVLEIVYFFSKFVSFYKLHLGFDRVCELLFSLYVC